ncbi:glycosyltransferase [Metabacillus elymi]|uniref:Glycosyltransferase n=1 Tax=Metabacillus elymi TaxID=2745198 RepID=A0ABX6RWX2_9BACI|nr:glycosyltransferase [Metabacillus sp. KUDC1714]QNF26189.1 glycosyltransferase [Metabacillus sp. KUDC1714]
MKKKLLFVIDSLEIGGAEKSLVSLLNILDSSKFEIDLILFKQGGDLERYVPNYINLFPPPEYYRFLNNEKFNFSKNMMFFYHRIKTSLNLRLNNIKKRLLHSEQVVYKSINKIMIAPEKKYDIAIAYSQGMPTYFVAHKVNAIKKFAWINTDYANTLYDKNIDYESYKNINKIIAVSKNTKYSVSQIREEYNKKVEIILDILDPNLINNMAAEEHQVVEFDKSTVNILTVGRLVSAKAYEKAIEVANLLKKEGYNFKWFAIGDGPDREKLQQLIKKFDLNEYFVLLGKKLNPYTYMKNCDIYVQTSIKEGFGLTVCEAKILKRPIVCTNFPTAKEIITHEEDGLIVEHDIQSIYYGIKKYLDNDNFKEDILKQLNLIESYSSVNEVEKFYDLVRN